MTIRWSLCFYWASAQVCFPSLSAPIPSYICDRFMFLYLLFTFAVVKTISFHLFSFFLTFVIVFMKAAVGLTLTAAHTVFLVRCQCYQVIIYLCRLFTCLCFVSFTCWSNCIIIPDVLIHSTHALFYYHNHRNNLWLNPNRLDHSPSKRTTQQN